MTATTFSDQSHAGKLTKGGLVAIIKAPLRSKHVGKLLKLCAAERRIDVWQAVVVANFIMPILPGMRQLCGGGDVLRTPCKLWIVDEDGTTTAGGDGLVAIKTQRPHTPERTGMPAVVVTAERLSRVFYQDQIEVMCNGKQAVKVNGVSEHMHGNQCPYDLAGGAIDAKSSFLLGLTVEVRAQAGRVNAKVTHFAVNKVWCCVAITDGICRGYKRQCGYEYFVTSLNACKL